MLVDLLKKIDYNAVITELENKIPSIRGLLLILHCMRLKTKYLMLVV